MPADLYTKSVLTIIAAALVGLLVQNSTRAANAEQNNIARVQICGFDPYGSDAFNCANVINGKLDNIR